MADEELKALERVEERGRLSVVNEQAAKKFQERSISFMEEGAETRVMALGEMVELVEGELEVVCVKQRILESRVELDELIQALQHVAI